MIIHSSKASVELEYLTASLANLPLVREMLVAEARKKGADYILWIDADQTFPEDALERLLAADRPVIGCNIPSRIPPHAPSAARAAPGKVERVQTTAELAARGEIERVDAMGLGFCLMKMNVLDGIEGPLFQFAQGKDGTLIGEDIWMFQRLREHGVDVFIDHGLSWQIGHIREQALTHAIVQRA